jgi:hypothetical protein
VSNFIAVQQLTKQIEFSQVITYFMKIKNRNNFQEYNYLNFNCDDFLKKLSNKRKMIILRKTLRINASLIVASHSY